MEKYSKVCCSRQSKGRPARRQPNHHRKIRKDPGRHGLLAGGEKKIGTLNRARRRAPPRQIERFERFERLAERRNDYARRQSDGGSFQARGGELCLLLPWNRMASGVGGGRRSQGARRHQHSVYK